MLIAILGLWVALDQDGYVWEYRALAKYDDTQVVARCEYQYIKINGVEQWRGIYYNSGTDFDNKFFPQKAYLENLASCVKWVNHFMYGDFYL